MTTTLILIGLSVLLVVSFQMVDKYFDRRKSKRESITRHRIRNQY